MMRISIIVPVLNEAIALREFLPRLVQAAPDCEIILVDGGSSDDSVAIAREAAATVVESMCGRAVQMNAGAARAGGDVLWFVHADSHLPSNASNRIEHALEDCDVAGGSFRLRIAMPGLLFRVRDMVANLLVGLGAPALGDRGLFCRRDIFEQIGGYPQLQHFEDAEFYRALKRYGRVVQLDATIVTSGRQYEQFGHLSTIIFYAVMMLLYCARVPLKFLQGAVRAYYRRR